MNLKELFQQETIVGVQFDELVFNFHFREPTDGEDLEFRRRTARMTVANGALHNSETSLTAPLWLFSKICSRITIKNTNGEVEEVGDDDKAAIPQEMKLQAFSAWQGRIKRVDHE